MAEVTEALLGAATFICGHPKSGTSLLASMLDGHPQLVVYPEETGYFRRIYGRLERAGENAPALLEEGVLHIFHWNARQPHPTQTNFPGRDYSSVPFEQVQVAFRRILCQYGVSGKTLLPAAVLAFGKVSGQLSDRALRWVEKTPYNEHFADEIYAQWPDARCLHVVRDPRDNFASYRRKHRDWTVDVFAMSWRASLERGVRNRRAYGERRYLILRYEDLVFHPKETMARVCHFLGIQDHASLRRPTRLGKPWQGNSMFGEAFDGVSASPVGRFRRYLSPEEVALLEAALSRQMEALEYEMTGRPSVPLRLQWYIFCARWWLRWNVASRMPGAGRRPMPVWMR